MALVPCKSCKHQVDTSAKICPNCGVAEPGVTMMQKLLGLVILGVVIAVAVSMCSGGSDDKPTSESAKPKVDDATCKKDLACWGEKHLVGASVYCKEPVEKLGKYSAKWTDGMLEPKFSHYRWLDKDNGSITYIGDKIQYQNGFGAFQGHIYECDFNTANNAVLDVRAQPGNL